MGQGPTLDSSTRKVHSNKLVYGRSTSLSPMIVCRFDKATALKLKRMAKEKGVSVAKIVRDLVDKVL